MCISFHQRIYRERESLKKKKKSPQRRAKLQVLSTASAPTYPGVCDFELSEDVLRHVVFSHRIHHKVLVPGWALRWPVLMALLLQERKKAEIFSKMLLFFFMTQKCSGRKRKNSSYIITAWRTTERLIFLSYCKSWITFCYEKESQQTHLTRIHLRWLNIYSCLCSWLLQ